MKMRNCSSENKRYEQIFKYMKKTKYCDSQSHGFKGSSALPLTGCNSTKYQQFFNLFY